MMMRHGVCAQKGENLSNGGPKNADPNCLLFGFLFCLTEENPSYKGEETCRIEAQEMAKGWQNRFPHYENGQIGCIWTIRSIFDFGYGRSTRGILPHNFRRNSRRRHVGDLDEDFKAKLNMLTNSIIHDDEEKEAMAVKMSIKELMEMDIINEEHQIHHKRNKTSSCGSFSYHDICNGNPVKKRRSHSLEEILFKEEDDKKSSFSFAEIKRKLKLAMAKDNQNEILLKEERVNKIYAKARKDLSEMIMVRGDEGEHCSSSRRSLGVVLAESSEKMKICLPSHEDHEGDLDLVIFDDDDDDDGVEGFDYSKRTCRLKVDFESSSHIGSMKLKQEQDEETFLSSGETSNEKSSERPSPDSVFQSIFNEDEEIIKESTETSFQPRQIQFEEHNQNSQLSSLNLDDQKLMFDHTNKHVSGVEFKFSYVSPHVFGKAIRLDIMNTTNWMNLGSEAEHMGVVIGDMIMDELLEDLRKTMV